MKWDDDYIRTYNEVVKKKLPPSFVAMYEKSNWLHDWYLKNVFIANTGLLIQTYSTKGGSTLQMEFANSGDSKSILLIYKNVYELNLNYSKTDDVCSNSPTGFGRCIANFFEIRDTAHVCHEFQFEGGTIRIICKGIGYRKIANHYWD